MKKDIVIIHLSDIHIKNEQDLICKKSKKIAQQIFSKLHKAKAVFILITGDITFSGQENEFSIAIEFIENISKAIKESYDCEVYIQTAPGNHDCDFRNEEVLKNEKIREISIGHILKNGEKIDEAMLEVCVLPLRNYEDFYSKITDLSTQTQSSKILKRHSYHIEDITISIDSLYIPWCSKIKEEQAGLGWPFSLNKKIDHVDYHISLLHHPLNWLKQTDYQSLRDQLKNGSDIILSGHEHQGISGRDESNKFGQVVYSESAALQENSRNHSSQFSSIRICTESNIIEIIDHEYNQKNDYYVEKNKKEYSLNKKESQPFAIKKANPTFISMMQDPGGPFKKKTGERIALSEIYVPHTLIEHTKEGSKNQITSDRLSNIEYCKGGMILLNQEKYGGTSLIRNLYIKLLETKSFPIYIEGSQIKNHSESDIDKLIEKSILEVFGTEGYEVFKRTASSSQILLVNDFDKIQVKPKEKIVDVLNIIKNRFPNFILLTSDLFDLKYTESTQIQNSLSDIRRFQIVPFKRKQRRALIEKWISIAFSGDHLDENDLLAKIDRAQTVIETITSKGIVPSLPFYVVGFLQGIEAFEEGGYLDSGLGDYYQQLIYTGLESTGQPRKEFTPIIEFCCALTWHLVKNKKKKITKEEYSKFCELYTKENIDVDPDSSIKTLSEASILVNDGGIIYFKYPYMFYYLKARFMSQRSEGDLIKSHLEECFNNLHLRGFANTVLFCAHFFSKNEFYLQKLTDTLRSKFQACEPITFSKGDVNIVSEIVAEISPERLKQHSPRDFRDSEDDVKDDIESRNSTPKNDHLDDDVDDREEELDFFSEITSLLKAVEILGILLKNQGFIISRDRRVELVSELMAGPLRALRAYFNIITDNKESIIEFIADNLKHQGILDNYKCKKEASYLLAKFLEGGAIALFNRTIAAIEDTRIDKDIGTAVKIINTPAVRVIRTGYHLCNPRELPKGYLMDSKIELECSTIGTRLLYSLLYRRIYRFSHSHQDKQWIASNKFISSAEQLKIDFGNRNNN